MNHVKKKIVLKFGGAANASLDHFPRICEIIEDHFKIFDQVIVVISAMKGMTDQLTQMAYKVSSKPKLRELDMLISIGERMSMTLLAIALNERGVNAISLTGSQSGIITTNAHSGALIIDIKPYRLHQYLNEGRVVIVAGFQGVSQEKEVTTLGRGGSDTTAVALGVSLGAEAVYFFKDVDGVYNQDPKKDLNAVRFDYLHYDEALKIVDSGAQILHRRCLHLAKNNAIPLKIFSFEKGKSLHTLINDAVSTAPEKPIFETVIY